jgi:toxin ParE1/3/4
MSQFRVSAEAEADLSDIWSYIAEDSPTAAQGVISQIVGEFATLAAFPQMGRRRDELAPALRSFPVKTYVIYYRPIEDGVEIIRVLHGARDIPPLFGG